MTWPPEATVARENMKFLGFPIRPFAKIARGKGASEIGIYSLPQGEAAIPGSGERLLTLRWQENGAVTVEGTGADEKTFSSEFERAPEVLLWGEELVVTAANGETRLTFGVTPRLAFGVAGGRNEGMKVTVLADSGWLDDRLITDRRAAFELSQKAGPRDAWKRISADYPGAFPEWIKAACAYAKLMKDEGNPIGGMQLLYGVEPFAAGAERDEVRKWVEEIMLKP
jgi:hypothetical protein